MGFPLFGSQLNRPTYEIPFILILAGADIPGDNLGAANAAISDAVATSNPVAVAGFFHCIYQAILHGLLATGTDHIGVLGDLSNHYGVVETKGRGMLLMHALLWARGSLVFTNLQNRLLKDTEFAARMFRYLEATIMQGVDESIPYDPEVSFPTTLPLAKQRETDAECFLGMPYDSKSVVRGRRFIPSIILPPASNTNEAQVKILVGSACPGPGLVPASTMDEFGFIHLARNHT